MTQNNSEVIPALREDSRAIWEIRYESSINAIAMSREVVAFETHDTWFQKKYFSGGESKCFVAKIDGCVAGYCRFDKTDAGDFNISIALLPAFQGRGLGQKLLTESMAAIGSGKVILASVRKDNQASLQLFKKNGFELVNEDKDQYYFKKQT